MRLLDRATEERIADYETGSLISIFNAGDGGKAWIHSSDSTLALSSSDDRLYASFNGSLYQRTKIENEYNPASSYQAGERVYHKGFVYESTQSLPSANWTGAESNQGDLVSHNGSFYELLLNLDTAKVDSFASVDAGAHVVTQPTNGGGTTNADAYKAGDIVKAADGSFFRSIKDRTDPSAVNWGNYDSLTGFSNPIATQGWTGNLPSTSYDSGRMYQMVQGASATEHGGAADSNLYNSSGGWGDATALVIGKSGVTGAENHYFLPKVSNWDDVQAHSATKNYSSGDIILHGGQFLQANSNLSPSAFNSADWTDVTSDVNDLSSVGSGVLADTFWSRVDLSVTNSTYWNEIAHANGVADFDSNYWQQIKPGMNRIDGSGSGAQVNSSDYSIWAQVGGVGGNSGDAIWGNRDAAEIPIPTDANFSYGAWTGSAAQGDYVLSGTKIYEARVATTNDPAVAGNESDWNLVADASTMTAGTVSEQANRRRFTDTTFWSQHYT